VAARTWLTVPGAASSASAHRRLDGVDHDEVGALALGQGGEDVADVGLAGERQRCGRQAEALGAQPHLRRRLLAREVDGAAAGAGEGGGKLQQQRRLADAGLAADQQRRARHDAAAGDAVELGEPGRDARNLVGGLGQGLELDHAPLRRPRQAGARRRRHVGLLDQRIPLAAGDALAGPARRHAPQFWQTNWLLAGLAMTLQAPAPS
jgi:hypothetical protein